MIRIVIALLMLAMSPVLAETAGGYGGYGTGDGMDPKYRTPAPTSMVKDGCEPRSYYRRFKGGCNNPRSWWVNRGR